MKVDIQRSYLNFRTYDLKAHFLPDCQRGAVEELDHKGDSERLLADILEASTLIYYLHDT